MNQALQQKLKTLPNEPGVYFHKNAQGEIIYIGKAAVLRNRVRQYFQKSRLRDPKTDALVEEIADTDWVTVDSEIDALFLEAEMVRRYLPPYNILLRDDKALSYVRITLKADRPTVSLTRRPLDDGAEYLGPYMSGLALRRSLKLLRRVFPYYSSESQTRSRLRASRLYQQIGLEPQLDGTVEALQAYRSSLRRLMQYLRGHKKTILGDLEKAMQAAALEHRFEDAARLRNQLQYLGSLKKQIIFSDREFLDMSKDKGLFELTDLLGLQKIPRRIEGFDISHMSGTDTVASMVVFEQGMPDKQAYRKFKMRIPGNDDFAHMNEVITRRVSPKNIKAWGLPDLFLIDGGKGQLAAAQAALKVAGINRPAIGLAKQYEQIVVSAAEGLAGIELSEDDRIALKQRATALKATCIESPDFLMIDLPDSSHAVKLLQRIRDESHRFAVSYHSTLKVNRQTVSFLDSVPGIGATTKKNLLRTFGSLRGVMQAPDHELEKVLGPKKTVILRQYIRAEKSDML